MKYNEHLNSEYWKEVCLMVKRRDGFRCRLCNSQHDLNVHHRTYDNRGNEMEHSGDLTTLCRRCHEIFHGKVKEPEISPRPKKQTKGKNAFRIIPHPPVDSEMPDGDPITLTYDLITRCMTNGTFTNATIRALGLTRAKMKRGWPSRLNGTPILRSLYREALEGRFIYNSDPLDP